MRADSSPTGSNVPKPQRPELDEALTEAAFSRWYWTMAELQPFARALRIAASGPKAALVERIAAHLGGRSIPEAPRRAQRTPQLTAPFRLESTIPPGQRASSDLRAFFEAEIGPAFRFNGHMRAFLTEGGATLADAVAHWHRTLGTELPTQSASLEFNAFTKE